MVEIVGGVSRRFNEFLLLPNRTRADGVQLRTPLVRCAVNGPPGLELHAPFTSAIMQAVSSPSLAIALARNGGLSFLHQNRAIDEQVADTRAVKNFTAGFVLSDTNVRPDASLEELWVVMRRTGHSSAAVTHDGTPHGQFLGLVTSRDFHPQRHNLRDTVSTRMMPAAQLSLAAPDITLSQANSRLWDECLDCLPVVDSGGRLRYLVFRADYADNTRYPHQLVDYDKGLRVGAGVNTLDYRERVPALIEAGSDVWCFDSSDGCSDGQVRVGAGAHSAGAEPAHRMCPA